MWLNRTTPSVVVSATAIIVATAALALVVFATLPTTPPASAATTNNGASFAVRCDFSHRNTDDPIVYPGVSGAAHSHDFLGNRSTKFDSTYESMLTAATTCTRPLDTSGYWFPTVKWNGTDLQPYRAVFYYRAGGKDHTQVRPFDANLEVINSRRVSWRCGVRDDGAHSLTPPTQCSSGVLGVRIVFPDCSNGQLDSTDHKSHMTYSRPQTYGPRLCPSTHPIPVPALTINANFKIPTTSGKVTLSSGEASTMHADFWNTWDQAELERLVKRCINEVPPSATRPEECRAPTATA